MQTSITGTPLTQQDRAGAGPRMLRTIVLLSVVSILPATSFSQERPVPVNKSGQATANLEEGRKQFAAMDQLALARRLILVGRTQELSTALVTAAQLLASTPSRALDVTRGRKEAAASAPKLVKLATRKPNPSPAELLAEAKKMGANDMYQVAYLEAVESQLSADTVRGSTTGPSTLDETVQKEATDEFRITFFGGEMAKVIAIGDGDTDLDVCAYDENGALVICDTDIDVTTGSVVTWVPAWTGTFVIKVSNKGHVDNNYQLIVN